MSINESVGSVGFTGLLTLVFVVLKLTDYIDWSWWWVTGPLWIPIVIAVVLSTLVLSGIWVFKLFKS